VRVHISLTPALCVSKLVGASDPISLKELRVLL
jgi:hypothetical protein